MDKKKLLLLIAALVVAIGTAFAARTLFVGASAPKAVAAAPQEPTGPKVLVAQKALPTGTIITTDAVSFQAWPKDMVRMPISWKAKPTFRSCSALSCAFRSRPVSR